MQITDEVSMSPFN